MLKHVKYLLIACALLVLSGLPAYAVLPNIFATQPSGNVAASLLDTNFTFLERQGVQGVTTTGSSNAYVATPADAWVTGYSSYVGRALTIVPNFTNTSAATVSVSGLGAASIYKNVGGVQTALASGDIVSGTPAIIICDGTGFLLANPTATSTSTSITQHQTSFTSTGTFTAPVGAVSSTVFKFTITGSGGAGGGGTTGAHNGGGGGAGATNIVYVSGLTAGTGYNVVVGLGGAGGNGAGGNGNTSSVVIGATTYSAGGGTGGGGAANQNAGGAGSSTTANATFTVPGGDGSCGATESTSNIAGMGGASIWGGGASRAGAPNTAGAGRAGIAYGSGGGGAEGNFTGGSGAPGFVLVEWVL